MSRDINLREKLSMSLFFKGSLKIDGYYCERASEYVTVSGKDGKYQLSWDTFDHLFLDNNDSWRDNAIRLDITEELTRKLNYRKIAEDIVANNFGLPINQYTETERFRIKNAVYKALRFDVIKEHTLTALKDAYEDLYNSASEEQRNELADQVAELYVYDEEFNADLSTVDNIYNLIDKNLDMYIYLEDREMELD